MNPHFKRFLAFLAVAMGVWLLYLEFFGSRSRSEGISWFWVVVAGAMLILGMAELLARRDPMIRP